MPADDYLLYLEYFYRVLDYRQTVEISMPYDVSDVPVHKHITRHKTNELCGGYPAVGATDPEKFGRLMFCKPVKELWISILDVC